MKLLVAICLLMFTSMSHAMDTYCFQNLGGGVTHLLPQWNVLSITNTSQLRVGKWTTDSVDTVLIKWPDGNVTTVPVSNLQKCTL